MQYCTVLLSGYIFSPSHAQYNTPLPLSLSYILWLLQGVANKGEAEKCRDLAKVQYTIHDTHSDGCDVIVLVCLMLLLLLLLLLLCCRVS